MQSFEIFVEAEDAGRADRLASELEVHLRAASPETTIGRRSAGEGRMDLGTILTVVISSGAATAIASGIGSWISKRGTAKLSIKADGELIAENITSSDVLKLSQLMVSRSQPQS